MTPTVLDLLIDLMPGVDDSPFPFYEQDKFLWDSFRRDLAALLNTRRASDDNMAGFSRSAESLLNYGLPDLSSKWHGPARVKQLQQALADCLHRFEPRLENPEVSIVEQLSPDLAAHFRVTAQLRGRSGKERVRFDAMVPAGSTQFKILKECP
jgi:type VI secretion system protein ImpF